MPADPNPKLTAAREALAVLALGTCQDKLRVQGFGPDGAFVTMQVPCVRCAGHDGEHDDITPDFAVEDIAAHLSTAIAEIDRLTAENARLAGINDDLILENGRKHGLLRERAQEAERLTAEADSARAYTIRLTEANVELLRWCSVASDSHIDHLCAMVMSLAANDETPRALRAISADGVTSELRRALAAERIGRARSEADVAAMRKEAEASEARALDAERDRDRLTAALSTAHATGRREGLEEAAREVERDHTHENADDCMFCAIAADIRALIPKEPTHG